MARRIPGDLETSRIQYDWDNWLDGTQWQLEKDVDFKCSVESFRSAAYQAARSRGIVLKMSVSAKHPDKIRIQAVLNS